MTTRRRATPLIAGAAILAALGWGVHHTLKLRDGSLTDFELIVIVAYIALVFTTIVPYFQRDRPLTCAVDNEYVLAVVPAHNEDPDMFTAMLTSVLDQTRPPDRLHIVENGGEGYEPLLREIVSRWVERTKPCFDVQYSFNLVGDKRAAQAVALDACPEATIHMTLDSDVRLGSPETIERAIAPFLSDQRVMSVCGFLLGQNQGRSLLTRLIDIGFIGSFLNGRASYSMLGSVAVNTGGLAFYRASVMRKYREHYLHHRVFGRKMAYGDDAMWTRYAMLEGKTLFQRDAFGFTLHPENMRHLRRQRTRWHRSWFWGNLWLIRHFNPLHPAWILTLWQFISFVWFTVAIPAVLLSPLVRDTSFSWLFFVWSAFVGYLTTLPYLSVKRPDMTFKQQLLTWALSPLAVLLNFYVGWMLRYVGLFTCLKTGWGTRQHVEVRAAEATQ